MSRKIRVPGEQHLVSVSTPAEAHEVMHILRTFGETANVGTPAVKSSEFTTRLTAIDAVINDPANQCSISRKHLTVIEGDAASGKSFLLTNFAAEFAETGHNVLFVTLEMSEDSVVDRISKVSSTTENGGLISVQQLPVSSQVSSIRNLLREFELETNEKVDAVLVDTVNLLTPDEPIQSYEYGTPTTAHLCYELNMLASDEDVAVVVTAQKPRLGQIGDTHMQEYSENVTVFTIVTSSELRASNKYQIEIRNSQTLEDTTATVEVGYDPQTYKLVNVD